MEPPPRLETVMARVVAAERCRAEKVSDAGFSARLGCPAADTVRATRMVCVGGWATGALTVIVPWYVPAASDEGSAVIRRSAGMFPLEGLACSQGAEDEIENGIPGIVPLISVRWSSACEPAGAVNDSAGVVVWKDGGAVSTARTRLKKASAI